MNASRKPASGGKPRLYHAPSSYYSMIARLALQEGGITYEPVFLDIHLRMSQQQPDYARLNAAMTVPTLELPGRILDQSRGIAAYALSVAPDGPDAETKAWVDLHYSFAIDELTFGGMLARNPIARIMIPKRLAAAHRRLLACAAAYPDLAEAYKVRAALFARRLQVFDPAQVVRLAAERRAEAVSLMDRLEAHLAGGAKLMTPPAYGLADVVWTVFLARMEFVGLGAELGKRPALAAYWRAMQARPSFAAADIWTRMHPLRFIGGLLGIAGR
jgi:ganglioside-induced differentiation-associated protein 1